VIQRLAILGATGSIGTSTVQVVRQHPERLRVTALAASGRRLEPLVELSRELRPAIVAVFDAAAAAELKSMLPAAADIEVVGGEEGLIAAATHPDVDRVVAAMVGARGLAPVHAALAAGKDVALANKESLVVAGRLLTRLARQRGAEILPIDSEHAALHQALRAGKASEVKRLVLTASGGPFRTRAAGTWNEISPQEALRHPTWSMGAKISIDSATMMNKGLELIEASHLFSVAPQAIDVVVHPQSIVHSLVEFCDGSWLAQLAVNDMVLPIQYALAFPDRWPNEFPALEPAALGSLDFEPVAHDRFPSIALARQALAMGESAPAVLNAANERAVMAFLNGAIRFPQIFELVADVLEGHWAEEVSDLDAALGWDRWGRRRAEEWLAGNRR